MLNIAVISGPSGAGNTTARYVFEELGYYIVENVPHSALDAVIDAFENKKHKYENICIMTPMVDFEKTVEILTNRKDISLIKILLVASEEVLRKRYTLTRHAHPLSINRNISLEAAIEKECKTAEKNRLLADFLCDTSDLTQKELRSLLYSVITNKSKLGTTIKFTSFGLKNGIPKDLDIFFDARLLPNPFWIDKLRELTGLDKEVSDYLLSFDKTKEYLENLINYLKTIFPSVIEEGRPIYNVGIACTGGQHRSTFVADYLCRYFASEYQTIVDHRDVDRLETRVSNE